LSSFARKAIKDESGILACKWNCYGQVKSSKEITISTTPEVTCGIARKAIREEQEYCTKGIVADRVSPVRKQQGRRKSPLFLVYLKEKIT